MSVDTRYITHNGWTDLTPTQVTYPNDRQVSSGYDALYRRNAVNETSGGGSIAALEVDAAAILAEVGGAAVTLVGQFIAAVAPLAVAAI